MGNLLALCSPVLFSLRPASAFYLAGWILLRFYGFVADLRCLLTIFFLSMVLDAASGKKVKIGINGEFCQRFFSSMFCSSSVFPFVFDRSPCLAICGWWCSGCGVFVAWQIRFNRVMFLRIFT